MDIDLAPAVAFVERAFVLLLAPAGIWFGWFLQRRDKKQDREHRQRERLRDKAEEVFAELSAVQDSSKAVVLHALRDFHGGLSEQIDFAPTVQLDRLRALLYMYFPGAEETLYAHAQAAYELSKRHSELIAEVQADQALNPEERLRRVKQSQLDTAQETNTLVMETVGKVSVFMSAEVKKLV